MTALDVKALLIEDLSKTGHALGFNGRPADAGALLEALTEKPYRNLDVGPGDIVLDLGAHIGTFTRAALEAGARRVIAVEPHPDSAVLLWANIERYGDRVMLVQAAVGVDDGTAQLYTARSPFASSVVRERGTPVEVAVIKLEELLETEPTVIKFDIEGAEYALLEPWPEFPESVRQVYVEFHPCDRFREKVYGVAAAASNAGWRSRQGRYPGESGTWPVEWVWERHAEG